MSTVETGIVYITLDLKVNQNIHQKLNMAGPVLKRSCHNTNSKSKTQLAMGEV